MGPDDTRRIFDKLDEHGKAIVKLETCVSGIKTSNGADHTRIVKTLDRLDERLTGHLDMEDANMNRMREDLHYLKGVVEERAKHRQQNPLYRLLKFLFACFGVKLP